MLGLRTSALLQAHKDVSGALNKTLMARQTLNSITYRLLADRLMLLPAAVSQTFCFCDNKSVVLPSDYHAMLSDRA